MIRASSAFDMQLVITGLFLLATMETALYARFAGLERCIAGWSQLKAEFVLG